VYEPLAASAATLDRSAMMAGAMLLNIGGGATHVALISRGRAVHTTVVPIGGGLMTSDLAMGLRTSLGEAEAIKLEFNWFADEAAKVTLGTNGSKRELDVEHNTVRQIVEPRLQELLRLVRSELAKAVAFDLRIEEIVITGGGANLSGIEEAIQEFFGLPTRIGVPSTVEGVTEEIRQPQYAAAVGLLVYGPTSNTTRTARPRKQSVPQRFMAWVHDLWN
jgi:cell division protein FtsA